MDKQEIKKILNKKYNREEWKILAKKVFKNVEYFKEPKKISTNNDKILDFLQIGNLNLNDDKTISLFELKLTKNLNIYKNKIELRNIVTKFIDQYSSHGVLVVFDNQGSDYRLTFSSKYSEFDQEGNIIDVETAPKRYTYLLGENESCVTPAERLHLLHNQNDDLKIEDILNAFNVDKITDEFFETYKRLYFEFIDELLSLRKKNKKIDKTFLENQISNEEFAKKFLGQIVFIYFLQKKGWLGIKRNNQNVFGNWFSGDKNFIRNLFEKKYCNYKNFFNDVLEPFFIALKTNLPENYYSKLDLKIPFMGGELFEPVKNYDWLDTDITISNELIEKILDNFEMFNFTIQENDPEEKEIAIDPEMLGKVFENLLEIKDRKSKGAFYTPRQIVKFICEKSLSEYLKANMEISLENLDLLLQANKDLSKNSFFKNNFEKIDNLLKEIKICDPAIGSGEFPVEMMNIVSNVRFNLNHFYKRERSRYSFKLNYIENSLYGNDIESHAIETAKLRLWLSLILDVDDYNKLKPLPNLEFKIVNGDSLLTVQVDLFNQEILNDIEKIKSSYFNETNLKKVKTFRNKLNELFNQIYEGVDNFDYNINFSEIVNEGGFDIILSNPPYKRIQWYEEKYKKKLIKEKFKTFESTGDIYALFIEKSINLLKANGTFGFIVSNKWMKNKYGKSLRKLIKENTKISYFINFKGEKIFKSAAVDTSITILSNTTLDNNIIKYSENLNQEFMDFHQTDLDIDRFNFYNATQLSFKKRLEKNFQKLEDFDVAIKGGIKTGFNKAFLLSKSIYEEIIKKDKKYKKILMPVLDGKNITPWNIEWSNQYLIHSHNGNSRRSVKPINVKKDYPKIYEILIKYKTDLEKRSDQGDHWTNLRDCDYFDKFNQHKIIWSDISTEPSFYLDVENFYVLNNCYLMFGDNNLLRYLIGILNSNVFKYLFENFYSGGELGQKGFRYIKEFLTKVPIPKNSKYQKDIIKLVDQINKPGVSKNEFKKILKEMNILVEKTYSLSEKERELINIHIKKI